jgi:nitronate monooxygenase
MSNATPPFPTAGVALAGLKAQAESRGSNDFSSLWSGQSANLAASGLDAGELTLKLADDAKAGLTALVAFP